MHKFQIAGRTQKDVTKKFFLTIPASKHYEALDDETCVSSETTHKFILEAVKIKEALNKHHISGGPSLKHILSRHPYPLSQGPVNGPHDSSMNDTCSPTTQNEEQLPNDGGTSLEEVMTNRTVFTHSEMQECSEWVPSENTEHEEYMNTFPKKMYTLIYQQYQIQGPASTLQNMDVLYTCNNLKCVIHCPCSICCDRQQTCKKLCRTEVCQGCNKQCIKHEIKPPRAFDPEINSYTLVTDKLDKFRFAHPYAGIPATCQSCRKDVLEHQLFHIVFHLRCRFCKFEARPFNAQCVVDFYDYKQAARNVHFWDQRTCKICLFEFTDKYSRKKHEATVHEKLGKYVCEYCDKRYSNITSLNYHKASHKPILENFVCNECGKQYTAETSLERHKKSVHGELSQAQNFECKHCGECFKLTTNLKRHLKEKHNRKKANLEFVEDLDKFEEFECDLCDSKFKRKSNMRRHVLLVHTKQENKFKCSQCNSSFPRKYTLTRHVKLCH